MANVLAEIKEDGMAHVLEEEGERLIFHGSLEPVKASQKVRLYISFTHKKQRFHSFYLNRELLCVPTKAVRLVSINNYPL